MHLAQGGKHVTFERSDNVVLVDLGPAPLVQLVPLTRDRLERMRLLQSCSFGGPLLLCAWISALMQQAAGSVSSLSRVGQRDLGIRPEGQELFLALETVLHLPELAAGLADEEEQSLLVGELVVAISLGGLLDLGVREHADTPALGVMRHLIFRLPPELPQQGRSIGGTRWHSARVTMGQTPRIS